MSGFYSLDDDDDEQTSIGPQAGPSRRQTGTNDALRDPRACPRVQPHGRSTANPIAAMLDDEDPQEGASMRDSQAANRARDHSRRNADREDTASVIQDVASVSSKTTARREMAPIDELRRAWANERAAPEILPWRGEAVDGVCSQIEEQMGIVDSLASDAATAEEEHIRLSLVELDVERARWLLRSYLRCRLDKIEQHAAYVSQDRSTRDRLSELERGYAARYNQICAQHFHSSVLDFLPDNMRSLDDKTAANHPSGRGDMVTRPDLDAPVFVRCLIDCGAYRFPGLGDVVYFTKGTIHLVRYNTIRRLVGEDKVELL